MTEAAPIFRHIMVPTDGSEPSIAAGRLGIRLAAAHGARVTLVYVVDAAIAGQLGTASGKTAQQVERDLERNGQRYLDYLSRLAAEAGLEATRTIRHGMPYSEIEALAREVGTDLIVMGQVGHSGPRRILIGSVTERVIEHAPCPVLVVK